MVRHGEVRSGRVRSGVVRSGLVRLGYTVAGATSGSIPLTVFGSIELMAWSGRVGQGLAGYDSARSGMARNW